MDDIKTSNFEKLDVMHHILSGFKAYYTAEAVKGVEVCRKSAGGAGYAAFTGLTEIAVSLSPTITYEGENTVMMLQSSRYVLKLAKKAAKGQQLPYPFEYISNSDKLLSTKGKGTTVEEFLDLNVIEQALAVRSAFQIRTVSKMLAENKEHAKV